MAQNAYRYDNAARTLPRPTTTRRVVRRRYQPAVWLKSEKRLVALWATGVLLLMLATVYTSIQIDSVQQANYQAQSKVSQVKRENDSLQGQIQSKTSREKLDQFAQKADMQQADDNVRNVNR
ncbi:cell division protein FtsL [Eupransor demetentiae]|uniref:Cell division protein FtsL n=1 Tax=Eupransor demetentiae TaxID=3109584 RepID=A0ABM9N4W9_9LACO|nr:Cell division protein FtsL (FtsL2) [Lactobacillaceae bacterium LMG 33000]